MQATVLLALDLAMKRSTTYHRLTGVRLIEMDTARLEPGTSSLDFVNTISTTSHADGFA